MRDPRNKYRCISGTRSRQDLVTRKPRNKRVMRTDEIVPKLASALCSILLENKDEVQYIYKWNSVLRSE